MPAPAKPNGSNGQGESAAGVWDGFFGRLLQFRKRESDLTGGGYRFAGGANF